MKDLKQLELNMKIKHYVSCGGYQWAQIKIHDNVWYLFNEAKNIDADAHRMLMPNKCFASLLNISQKKLARMSLNGAHTIYYNDVPTNFVTPDHVNKPVHKTKQVMWTAFGMSYVLERLQIKGVKINSCVTDWVATHKKEYEMRENIERSNLSVSSIVADSIDQAIKYVTELIEKFNETRVLNYQLLKTISDLQAENKSLAISAVKPSVNKSNTNVTFKDIQLNEINSLSQFLSSFPGARNSDKLTKAGLYNSDQIYSIFSNNWVDPKTNKLINKKDFQNILKHVFHKHNSTHRAPVLKATAIRENYAIVCTVPCKKKPNPVDENGNILDTANPAYTSNDQPCIRLQPRYTSKAVELLVSRWESYVKRFSSI